MADTASELKSQQTRVLPIAIRSNAPAPPEHQPETPVDGFWREVTNAIRMREANLAMNVAGLQEPAKRAESSPIHDTIDFAKSVGFDLGEMGKQRAEEVAQMRTSLAEKDREVHEMRIREMDGMLARIMEGAKKLQEEKREEPKRPQTFMEKFDTLLGEQFMVRFASKMFGEDKPAERRAGMGALIDEMAAATGQPPDVLWQRFAGSPQDPRTQMLEGTGTDPTLRLGLMKLLIEGDIEERKALRQLEIEAAKAKSIDKMVDTLKESLPDALQALRGQASEWNARGAERRASLGPQQAPAAQPEALEFACSTCHKGFQVLERRASYHCPYCGEKLDAPPETAHGVP